MENYLHSYLNGHEKIVKQTLTKRDAGKTEWFNILKLDDIMSIIGEYKCQPN
jgi:hypothetical protein